MNMEMIDLILESIGLESMKKKSHEKINMVMENEDRPFQRVVEKKAQRLTEKEELMIQAIWGISKKPESKQEHPVEILPWSKCNIVSHKIKSEIA